MVLWSGALFLSLAFVLTSSAWLTLRYGAGLRTLEYADLAWPARWNRITEARRHHFQEQAMLAIRQGNIRAAGVALFSAAQTGRGTPEQNRALARLATLGAYYSLADDLHAADLAAHPEQAGELSLYWHDDLLIANRPGQLAKLALDRLASANAPREFWLGAFLDAIRQPRVAAEILASRPARSLPHPSLRHALEARAALDAHDIPKAADRLLAFAGMPPGQAARRFLALSWMDAGELDRARAAALSASHPAKPGELACLAYVLLHCEGRAEDARAVLRPLFADSTLRADALSALIFSPNAESLRELIALTPAPVTMETAMLANLWVASRRAGAADIEYIIANELDRRGAAPPAELREPAEIPLSEEKLAAAAGMFPLDREVLRALRARKIQSPDAVDSNHGASGG